MMLLLSSSAAAQLAVPGTYAANGSASSGAAFGGNGGGNGDEYDRVVRIKHFAPRVKVAIDLVATRVSRRDRRLRWRLCFRSHCSDLSSHSEGSPPLTHH